MKADEMSELVIHAALEDLRQTSFIPFWHGSHNVTPQEKVSDFFSQTKVDERKARNLLEKASELASRDSFELQFRTEIRDNYDRTPSYEFWVVLKNGYEWSDAMKDAWAGIENANPWFLTDNALKLLKWIQSPRNTGDFVRENRIGSQAYFLGSGSYSRIETYVREICLKTPHHVRMEKTGRWRDSSYKLSMVDKEGETPRTSHDNPVFPYLMSKRDAEAPPTFARMLEDLVLNDKSTEDREFCILFRIHSRVELTRALPAVAADRSQTPYELKKFLRELRLARGLRPAATLDDAAEAGWMIGVGLEEDWTWEEAKESILESRTRKDPCEAYGLSSNAGKLLKWIWNLHDDEIQMDMTPLVESVAEEQVGIKNLRYEQHSGVILQLLLEEINERTSYDLRLIPWSVYSRIEHRILIRKKKTPDEEITRLIQIRGLEKNVALSASEIGKRFRISGRKARL